MLEKHNYSYHSLGYLGFHKGNTGSLIIEVIRITFTVAIRGLHTQRIDL